MLFSLGVKELWSKGVKTLAFFIHAPPLGEVGWGCLFIHSPPLGEVVRGLVFTCFRQACKR